MKNKFMSKKNGLIILFVLSLVIIARFSYQVYEENKENKESIIIMPFNEALKKGMVRGVYNSTSAGVDDKYLKLIKSTSLFVQYPLEYEFSFFGRVEKKKSVDKWRTRLILNQKKIIENDLVLRFDSTKGDYLSNYSVGDSVSFYSNMQLKQLTNKSLIGKELPASLDMFLWKLEKRKNTNKQEFVAPLPSDSKKYLKTHSVLLGKVKFRLTKYHPRL